MFNPTFEILLRTKTHLDFHERTREWPVIRRRLLACNSVGEMINLADWETKGALFDGEQNPFNGN